MSTVSTSPPAKRPPDESDPFRYGWRYVTVRGPDGTETLDQVPLTLEDVLFPETGDFIVQTDDHRRLELIAYRYAPEAYQRVASDARGWVWLAPLGLWLGVVQDPQLGCDRLACFDAETGKEIGDYQAVSEALAEATATRQEAEARANAEANAREEAEARVRELEEVIRQLGKGY